MATPVAPERWKRIEEIFEAASDLPPDECQAFVRSACGDDVALRREVISLLSQDTSGTDLVANVIAGMAASVIDNSLPAGTQLGPYRVLREIGHGGMGSIHLAVRTDESFEKRVAVKVVKRGMDTAAVLERFRRERRILAGLEHPYIARMLDGGTTPDGRPYFVMEFVEGIAVTEYCSLNRLGLKARCELFGKICEAVAHAHRNLVVHRDLKPGNIWLLLTACRSCSTLEWPSC